MLGRRAVMGGVALALPAYAQGAWPERAVTIVNPFAAGGFTDGFGRIVFAHFQRVFGQPFVVDYRPGAGATLGSTHVARSAPDGYTLLYSPTTTWSVAPHLYRNPGYDPLTDLAHIGIVAETPMVLCIREALPWRGVADLLPAARAEPGKYSYASAGAGSLPHLMGTFFAALAKVELNHVPYRGGGPAMNDLVAGHVDMFWEAIPNVTQHAEVGRIRALAITGPGRAPALPNVPTVTEAGFADVNLTSWIGLGGPAGMPAGVVAALNRELNAALGTAEVREAMQKLSLHAVGGTPEAMRARTARDGTTYARIIREARITVD